MLHLGGKIEQHNKHPLKTRDDLSMAYTPGVARVCTAIADDRSKAFEYTIKRNTVAVVSDGSAVLGLGDIGPEAAMPVMEGKAMLFKEFAGVDAFPICLDTNDPGRDRRAVKLIAPDLRRHQPRGHLRAALLRDRGRGSRTSSTSPSSTTTSTGPPWSSLAALLNALKIVGKPSSRTCASLIVGLGAAGVAVTKIMLALGRDATIIGCDRSGALSHRARRTTPRAR